MTNTTLKTVLGLDLGTNSIGWALTQQQWETKTRAQSPEHYASDAYEVLTGGEILGMGSRIIPMSQDKLGDFEKGNTVSQTKERTEKRGSRRLRERYLLRRQRLHRVLNVLGFLPEHYANSIDFVKRLGQFLPDTEPKIAYNNGHNFFFKEAYAQMRQEFAQHQPEMLAAGKEIPYDWTIYFLRVKALREPLTGAELAWLLLQFNQKRGYYQLRGEEEETENTERKDRKEIELHTLKITEVTADAQPDKDGNTWYNLQLENGWVYKRKSRVSLENWKGTTRDFIVTTELDENDQVKIDKYGKEKRSFRSPDEDDWQLRKTKTESHIAKSGRTVGQYIYNNLLHNPTEKIKGKLVRVIERKFYKEELVTIMRKQLQWLPSLQNTALYEACVKELYPNNLMRQNILLKKDFEFLFVEDIIFYQRPLRSKKSQISDCPMEARYYQHKGETKTAKLKCISRSHPLFQEFRLWQWIKNLKIYHIDNDKEPSKDFLQTPEQIADLFDFLHHREEISEADLIKFLVNPHNAKDKSLTGKAKQYRWNYVRQEGNDKAKMYPCAETKAQIAKRLSKIEGVPDGFLTSQILLELWHLIYSVTDKQAFEIALGSFAQKHSLPVEQFKENFKKMKPYEAQYGSYSEKAIKKLLPLMRVGRHWSEEAISPAVRARLETIADKLADINYSVELLETVADEQFSKHTLAAFLKIDKENIRTFSQGLRLHEASYLVYNRHSEGSETEQWTSPKQLGEYISRFKQHSLRNPIVEQVILETLRLVKALWEQNLAQNPDFKFTEIHVELARELKKNAAERKELTDTVLKNESTNLRLKKLLIELEEGKHADDVRAFSPNHLEILKIYEEGALQAAGKDIPEDIQKIAKQHSPSKNDLVRYRCWLEQGYRSPYTGEIIPLSKLFTPAYEIEHVIPRSRYFDDSLSNKIICEAAVNKEKGNMLGYEFIKKYNGKHSMLPLLSLEEYENFVKKVYAENKGKLKKLLLEEIPEKMINRQLNDTRYLSKFITSVLSNIVRVEKTAKGKPDDGVNSVNLVVTSGSITSTLRQDWGLNNVWNTLIAPRFQRLNEKTGSELFGSWTEKKDGKKVFQTKVPIEIAKGFSNKRIDHRHHALDALIVAFASRNHINYLNNQSASDEKEAQERQKNREGLRQLLCHKDYAQAGDDGKNYKWVFNVPYLEFVPQAKEQLEKTVVSFKQNLRIINKSVNRYESWKDAEGNLRLDANGQAKKQRVKQTQGDSWAIRKSLHKDTVLGRVSLKQVKEVSFSTALDKPEQIQDKSLRKYILALVAEGKDKKAIAKHFKELGNQWQNKKLEKVAIVYWDNDFVATRKSLDISFSADKIESITDTGIQKILINYLKEYEGQTDEKGKPVAPETLAFTPEGIEQMNRNIALYNNGKPHKPIIKVRCFESLGSKFCIGEKGNKKTKYAEADKGTNLFFAVYQGKEGGRGYKALPLNEVVERQKLGLTPASETNEKGERLLFTLSPNDLVYVPTQEEITSGILSDFKQASKLTAQRVYKFVSCTGSEAHFVTHNYAKEIMANENGSNNKSERMSEVYKQDITWDDKGNPVMIKSVCFPIQVDRLGNISRK